MTFFLTLGKWLCFFHLSCHFALLADGVVGGVDFGGDLAHGADECGVEAVGGHAVGVMLAKFAAVEAFKVGVADGGCDAQQFVRRASVTTGETVVHAGEAWTREAHSHGGVLQEEQLFWSDGVIGSSDFEEANEDVLEFAFVPAVVFGDVFCADVGADVFLAGFAKQRPYSARWVFEREELAEGEVFLLGDGGFCLCEFGC